ncbi:MAG: efflux RND transporter periplasmic adaptor subunit [Planctomycetota bacterium]
MKRLKRPLVLLAVLVAFAVLVVVKTGLLATRYGPAHPPAGAAAGTAPAPGGTLVVARREIPVRRRAVGSVVPRSPVVVSAQVMAAVIEVRPRVGEEVEAGALLAVLDDRDLRARVSAAEAALVAARSQATEAEANTARARAERIRAAADRERMQRLVESGATTARDLDVAVAGDDSAAAAVAAAEAAALAAGSGVAVAEKELEAARVAESHARIVASRAGVISRRLAEPGEIVLPGGPIVEMHDPTELRLEAAVPEADAARLVRGDAVRVLVPAATLEIGAVIDEIVPAADPSTRSVLVKVALPATPGLREGVRGTLLYNAGVREAIGVPGSVLRRRGQVESVEVLLPGGRTVRRHVRTGDRLAGDLVEVLTGLAAGETILVPEKGDER